jgi:hypothetical protein
LQNDTRSIGAWLAAGADINAADYDGRTALHVVRVEYLCSYLKNNHFCNF